MYEEIQRSIFEIQQPRSNFQLEKFVVGQHLTPEMKFYQTCLELQDLIYKYKIAQLAIKKQNLKIARLRQTGDELDELEAQELELGQEQTNLAMVGAERELTHLLKIYDGFETKYTRSEIEAAEPQYWEARLTGNAKAMLMANSSVSHAQIEAMAQAGILENFIEEVATSKKELGL
jgi:hypothetical protein